VRKFLSLFPSCNQLEYGTRDFTRNYNILGQKRSGISLCKLTTLPREHVCGAARCNQIGNNCKGVSRWRSKSHNGLCGSTTHFFILCSSCGPASSHRVYNHQAFQCTLGVSLTRAISLFVHQTSHRRTAFPSRSTFPPPCAQSSSYSRLHYKGEECDKLRNIRLNFKPVVLVSCPEAQLRC